MEYNLLYAANNNKLAVKGGSNKQLQLSIELLIIKAVLTTTVI